LREDVAVAKDAEFFASILSKINTRDWHSRKDFLVRRRVMGRKKYVVKPQKLWEPYWWQFEKLDLTEAQRAFFVVEFRYSWSNRDLVMHYVFKEPWRFVLRVRPNMIDEVRIRDAAIESRISEIKNYLDRTGYRRQQDRLLRGHTWHPRRDEAYHDWKPFKNMPLHRVISETKEEVYKE
jgi:hypothetical protein